MRIAIADGYQEDDYIINLFLNKKNKISVINSNMEIAKTLSVKNNIDVIFGNSNKAYDLQCAQTTNADLFIALSANDIRNYIACQMAKMIFNVKKVIAIVENPKNVEIFKKLGIDSVISSTYLLGQTIKSELSIESMINTLSFENNKIVVTEFEVLEKLKICNKALKDIKFPDNSSVCCIYRYSGLIIPNGNTVLLKNDKILVVSSFNDKKKVKDFITRE